MMTFDNSEELKKITSLHSSPESVCDSQDYCIRDRLILRIAVADPTASSNLSLKFGAEPVEVAPVLLQQAADMGANVCGIRWGARSSAGNAFLASTLVRGVTTRLRIAQHCNTQSESETEIQ